MVLVSLSVVPGLTVGPRSNVELGNEIDVDNGVVCGVVRILLENVEDVERVAVRNVARNMKATWSSFQLKASLKVRTLHNRNRNLLRNA